MTKNKEDALRLLERAMRIHFHIMDNNDKPSGFTSTIMGVSIVVCENSFQLPAVYRKIGLKQVLKAWGIFTRTIENRRLTLVLPEGWIVCGSEAYRVVTDSQGNERLLMYPQGVQICPPIRIWSYAPDDEVTNFVGVYHHHEEMFRSATWLEGQLKNQAAEKIYWDEARALVKKQYPLLNKDPNAYW